MAYNIEAKMRVLKTGGERVTSAYGNRTIFINGKYNTNFHSGIDVINRVTGTDYIVAPTRGRVTATRSTIAGYSEVYSSGNYVKLEHSKGFTTEYYHLAKGRVDVKVGQVVEKGQVLGFMGSTGWSTGNHLHFGIRINGGAVDPESYLLGNKTLPDYGGGTTVLSESKIFLNGAPVYISSTAKSPSGKLTGTYYIWGSAVINGRYRVTNSAQNIGKTGQVTGWVNASDIAQETPKQPDNPAGQSHVACNEKIAGLESKVQTLQTALGAVKSIVSEL